MGLREIIIEGDAQVVITASRNPKSCSWPIQKVVEGSLQSLSCFKAWTASHLHKSGNEVAHLMAKMAKTLSTCKIWVEDILPIIVDQVLKDVTNLFFCFGLMKIYPSFLSKKKSKDTYCHTLLKRVCCV